MTLLIFYIKIIKNHLVISYFKLECCSSINYYVLKKNNHLVEDYKPVLLFPALSNTSRVLKERNIISTLCLASSTTSSTHEIKKKNWRCTRERGESIFPQMVYQRWGQGQSTLFITHHTLSIRIFDTPIA